MIRATVQLEEGTTPAIVDYGGGLIAVRIKEQDRTRLDIVADDPESYLILAAVLNQAYQQARKAS